MTTGTVMIFVAPDGRVIADAADFEQQRPGGFTIEEAQRHRCDRALAAAVMLAFANPVLLDATSEFERGSIVRQLETKGYRKHLIRVEVPAA